MRRRTLAATLVLTFLALFALSAVAQEQPNQRPTPVQMVVRFLQLSEDQAHQLQTLLTQRQETIRALSEQIRTRGQRLESLLNSANPDPAAVGALVLEIHGLQRQIHQAREDFQTAFRNLLNQEQQERFAVIQRVSRLVPVIGAFARLGLLPPPANGARPQRFDLPMEIPRELMELEER